MTAKRTLLKRFIISLISLTFIATTALAATGAAIPASAAVVPGAAAGLPAHIGASLAEEVGSPVLYDPRSGNTEVYVVGSGHALFEKAWNPSMGWSAWIDLGGVVITI